MKLSLSEEGIDDIFALSNLSDNDIDCLKKYKNKDNGTTVFTPTLMADRNLIQAFLQFVINSQLEVNPITGRIAQEGFDSFWIKPNYIMQLG